MVRILRPAIVTLGEAAVSPYQPQVRATESRFRDADGTERPARLVEFM